MHDLQPTSSCCRPSGATAFALKGKQTDQSPAVKPCAGHGVTRDHGAIFAIEVGRPAASALIFRLVETECKAIRAACLIGDLRPELGRRENASTRLDRWSAGSPGRCGAGDRED